ncbi:hypothetical protein O4H66_23325 [Comamonadaceae bacterium G21597-S1]|nr:hypothetical protein [Comamonadaceae bacterium G21597-S1]
MSNSRSPSVSVLERFSIVILPLEGRIIPQDHSRSRLVRALVDHAATGFGRAVSGSQPILRPVFAMALRQAVGRDELLEFPVSRSQITRIGQYQKKRAAWYWTHDGSYCINMEI